MLGLEGHCTIAVSRKWCVCYVNVDSVVWEPSGWL